MATLNLGKLYQGGNEFLIRSTDIYDVATKQTIAQFVSATNTSLGALQQAVANKTPAKRAATIAARDALTVANDGIKTNDFVYVVDASGDPTVNSGAALYIATVTGGVITYDKMAEYESMDVVVSWNDVQNKPANIQDAIDKRHEHANKSVLDGISADGTSNNLVYNSIELGKFTGISVGSTFVGATNNDTQLQIVVEAYDPEA